VGQSELRKARLALARQKEAVGEPSQDRSTRPTPFLPSAPLQPSASSVPSQPSAPILPNRLLPSFPTACFPILPNACFPILPNRLLPHPSQPSAPLSLPNRLLRCPFPTVCFPFLHICIAPWQAPVAIKPRHAPQAPANTVL
jgi:hypothetical protein